MLTRRKFFTLLAAPAIVHAGNLMPVRALAIEPEWIAHCDFASGPDITAIQVFNIQEEIRKRVSEAFCVPENLIVVKSSSVKERLFPAQDMLEKTL